MSMCPLYSHSFETLRSYNRAEKELDGAKLRSHLLGGHVAGYMRRLQDKNPEEYQSHFSRFLKAGLTAESLEEMYKNAHTRIRDDPTRKPRAEVSPNSCSLVSCLLIRRIISFLIITYHSVVI